MLKVLIILLSVFVVSILLIKRYWSFIKRQYLIWKIKERTRNKKKFNYDNAKQQRTVQMIERLIRDPKSRLEKNTEGNYYVVHGEIYAMFNKHYAFILNGKYDNTTPIYEAIYQNLISKYENRKRSDVLKLEQVIEAKHQNILDFINNDIKR